MSEKLNEITGHKMAGLTMDLMSKLRDGVIGIKEFEKFLIMLRDERKKIFGTANPKINLLDSNIAVEELTEEINFQKLFTKNKNVKYYLGDNFKKHVLDPAKNIKRLPGMSFSKHQFTETIYDKEIMENFSISKSSGLMSREEILWTIADLTSKQPKGEAGALINNEYSTIIGYMLCDDGVVRVVYVGWSAGSVEWFCLCYDLDNWNADNGMLSRNKVFLPLFHGSFLFQSFFPSAKHSTDFV